MVSAHRITPYISIQGEQQVKGVPTCHQLTNYAVTKASALVTQLALCLGQGLEILGNGCKCVH